MAQLQKQITKLRKQLPKKGWVELVMEFTEDRHGKPLVTRDQVLNFFQLKAVKKEAQLIIVEASLKAVEKRKTDQQQLSQLLQSV